MSDTPEKSRQIGVRVPVELHDKLVKATTRASAYRPSMSQIVVRGIELALAELEKDRKRG